MPPPDWPVGKSVGNFLEGCERAQLNVFSATPGLSVLGALRKQAEQAMMSKPVSSIPPWPLLQLLPPGSCPDFPQQFECDLRVVLK